MLYDCTDFREHLAATSQALTRTLASDPECSYAGNALFVLFRLDNTSVIHTTIYAFIIATFNLTTCFDSTVSSSGQYF